MDFESLKETIMKFDEGEAIIILNDLEEQPKSNFMIVSELINPKKIEFLRKYSNDLIFQVINRKNASRLGLELKKVRNREFSVSLDSIHCIENGNSDVDKSITIKAIAHKKSKLEDFIKPGNIIPLVSSEDIDFKNVRLEDIVMEILKNTKGRESAIITRVMNFDGEIANAEQAQEIANMLNIDVLKVSEFLEYKKEQEDIFFEEEMDIESVYGKFKTRIYKDKKTLKRIIAIIKRINPNGTILKLHLECIASEVFGFGKCNCKSELDYSIKKIFEEDNGVILYFENESLIKSFEKINLNHKDFEDSLKNYGIAYKILKNLEITKVMLLNKNQNEVEGISNFGIEVLSVD